MQQNSNLPETLAIITGCTAVISSFLTLLITGLNNRWSDKRKHGYEKEKLALTTKFEKEKFLLTKKIEIAEGYYHFTRESLINIKRVVFIYEHGDNSDEDSTNYIDGQLKLIQESTQRLVNDTMKYNLTEIYFDIEYSTSVMAESVSEIMGYNTMLLNLKALAESASVDDKPRLDKSRSDIFEEYISYMRSRAAILERDLAKIKDEMEKLSLNLQFN